MREPPKLTPIEFLALSGSVSSLTALLIVLFDRAALSGGESPQLLIWQLVLALICLIGVGCSVVGVAHKIGLDVREDGMGVGQKVVRVFALSAIGLLLVAVFVDGFFAALYWRLWFSDILLGFLR